MKLLEILMNSKSTNSLKDLSNDNRIIELQSLTRNTIF